ncbi:MAG: Gfo/Idh/MocA family oxidoreductase [Burkholderiales bacterium]|nr:Gfo/Idh/MocA family oxidoreductase [Burkholderiales bacterium]
MLRAALFGLGRWGNRLLESVQESSKIRITAGISRDPSRHAELARRTGIRIVKSYANVLKSPEIDAVVLATPHSQHCAQVVQAAAAGKHVFVEKPFTLTRKTAERAVDACRQANVTLALGFNRRFSPVFADMVRRIEAGEIGDVVHVEGQNSGPTGYSLTAGTWRSARKEAPGGGMTARGIHALDCMIRIAGPVSRVYARSQKLALAPEIDIDDTTALLLDFQRGATGALTTVFVTGDYWRVMAIGTKGWFEIRSDTELVFRGLSGAPQRTPFEPIDRERAELEAFADAVAAGQGFLVPPQEMVNGIAVLESIEKSSAKRRAIAIAPYGG